MLKLRLSNESNYGTREQTSLFHSLHQLWWPTVTYINTELSVFYNDRGVFLGKTLRNQKVNQHLSWESSAQWTVGAWGRVTLSPHIQRTLVKVSLLWSREKLSQLLIRRQCDKTKDSVKVLKVFRSCQVCLKAHSSRCLWCWLIKDMETVFSVLNPLSSG